MKKCSGSLCAAVLVFAACSTSGSRKVDSGRTRPDTATNASAPEPQAPSASDSQEIYIDTIVGANPVRVSGRARTFENTVQVRVRDARGDSIAEVFTTSRGEMGHHNPYSAEVWVVRDPGPRVTIDAFEYSAKDGSVRSLTSQVLSYDIERIRVTLMIPVGECGELRAFTRVVPKSVGLARLLVEMLVAGPDSAETVAGANSPFPRGSRVDGVVLRDGTLTVDFNERTTNNVSTCAATSIRNSLTRTLQLLPTVKRVVVTAAGVVPLVLSP